MEPGAPRDLIGRMDAVAFKLQNRLSESFKNISDAEQRERGAMAEFYAEKRLSHAVGRRERPECEAGAVAKVIERAGEVRPAPGKLPDARCRRFCKRAGPRSRVAR